MEIATLFTITGSIVTIVVVFELIRLLVLGRRAVVSGTHAIPVSQSPNNATHAILVIGDSTAFGTGAKNPNCSLVGRLALDAPHVSIENAAQNGMHARELAQRLARFQHRRFDYVMIHIGGIDTIALTPQIVFQHYVKHALDLAKNIATKNVFLISVNNAGLVPLFRFPLNHLFAWRSQNFSRVCAKLCHERAVIHIPLFAHEADDLLCADKDRYFSEDRIHPNDAGYGLWYSKISSIVLPHITE